MANRIQIVLEAQDAASGVIRGLTSQLGVFGNVISDVSDVISTSNNFIDLYKKGLDDSTVSVEDMQRAQEQASAATARLAETLAVALVDALKASYQAYSEYATSVRDLSLISGESAESTSRLIQVLDDFEITADDAVTAARVLKEKGLSPNIDTLAKLADEFKKINDPAERMQFIQENLGRAGAKWVNILNQSSDSLRKMSAEVDKNLILSDQQIKMYEVQRLAIDNVKDKYEGWMVGMGANLGNVVAYGQAMNRASEIIGKNILQVSAATMATQEWKDAMNQAIAEQLQSADASVQQGESMKQMEEATKAAEEAMKRMSDANKDFLSTLSTMQSNYDSYSQKYNQVNADMSLTDDERKAKLQELADEYELQNHKIILGILERKLTEDGTLDDKELNWLLQKGEAWGIYSETVVEETRKAIQEANNLASAIEAIPTEKTVTITTVTNGDVGSVTQSSTSNQRVERRAKGGSVGAGKMYEVTENNVPELLNMNGKQFLMMPSGANGNVQPINGGGGGGASSQNDTTSQLVSAVLSTKIDMYEFARVIAAEVRKGNK